MPFQRPWCWLQCAKQGASDVTVVATSTPSSAAQFPMVGDGSGVVDAPSPGSDSAEQLETRKRIGVCPVD